MPKSSKHVVEQLKSILANSYVLYLKTQNYHWNVTGAQFAALHTLFGTQYEGMATAIDEIAERIRALGSIAPGSFKEFQELSIVKESKSKDKPNAKTMLKTLRDDHYTLIGLLEGALKAAQSDGDEPTADLMIERIAEHQKNAWMLDSSIE